MEYFSICEVDYISKETQEKQDQESIVLEESIFENSEICSDQIDNDSDKYMSEQEDSDSDSDSDSTDYDQKQVKLLTNYKNNGFTICYLYLKRNICDNTFVAGYYFNDDEADDRNGSFNLGVIQRPEHHHHISAVVVALTHALSVLIQKDEKVLFVLTSTYYKTHIDNHIQLVKAKKLKGKKCRPCPRLPLERNYIFHFKKQCYKRTAKISTLALIDWSSCNGIIKAKAFCNNNNND